MLVCPFCRIALSPNDPVCPRDGYEGEEAPWVPVPKALHKRFSIIEPFAHGDTGSLYLADEPETGRRGLLKVLSGADTGHQAERQRLRRELVKQATIHCDQLAAPMATGETDGTLWLFREWVDGVSLAVKLSRDGTLAQPEAMAITAQVATALDQLHRGGLLHRDVKPGHIILQPQPSGLPRVVVIDAGLAKSHEIDGRTVMGTPEYVAPEQLQGKLVSFRSDLYALGCVLHELLTGHPPFVDDDPAAVLRSHVDSEPPPAPSGLPSGLSSLAHSLLARDPQDRPFSAQKLRRALDPFLPDGTPSVKQPTATFAKPPQGARGDAKKKEGGGTLPPPHSVRPSRIPPPPGGRPSSAPPPRSASAPPINDATQPVDIDHIVGVSTLNQSSAPPPTPDDAKTSADSTQQVQIEQVLEVAKMVSKPPPAPEDALTGGVADSDDEDDDDGAPISAEHTQQLKLEQVLAVSALARSKPPTGAADSKPPPSKSPSSAPRAFSAIADTEPAPATPPEGPAPVVVGDPTADESSGVEVEVEADSQPVAQYQPGEPATEQDLADDDLYDDEEGNELPTVVAPHNGVQGSPASDAPASPAANESTDHALTVPRDSAAAVAQAARMSDPQHWPPADGDRRKLGVYLAAAAALLFLIWGAAAMFGDDDPDGTVEQDEAALAAAAQPAPAAPNKEPKAPPKADKKPDALAAITPTVTQLDTEADKPAEQPQEAKTEVAPEPEPEEEQAAPAEEEQAAPVEEAEEEAAEEEEAEPAPRAKRSKKRSRRERRRAKRQRERRARRKKAKASSNNREAWAQAREEARKAWNARDFRRAAASYQKAARANPRHAGTWAGLGAAKLKIGDARGAVTAYKKAVRLRPRTSGFHAALAKAYKQSGDRRKAKASYEQALKLDPKNKAARNGLRSL